MNSRPDRLTVNIDSRILEVERGTTILRASEQHNIYIPNLCAHKELAPFGGCRMCIVEVEGMRGFPTACTTPVENGMVIRTNTAQINEIRAEILQLILSEHPCSCLICEENEACRESTNTIRKVGVTTGCRFCPNDRQCELQDMADRLGVKEVKYPIYYRNLPVEKDDPFYDRDYNLCILCGRCVRICQEVRGVNTLSFKQRGRQTVIGPAYKRTHMEAGCEFCGACVSVCPTGALSEKAGKWEGKPDREVATTCALCSIGCNLRLLVKGNAVIGSLPGRSPAGDDNNDQLCVKGRFCITELVNSHRRLGRPYKIQDSNIVPIPLEEAIETAAEKLSGCAPHEFAMVVSSSCTNEDLYIAQKFARVAMGSNNIETYSSRSYGTNFGAYSSLMGKAAPMSELEKASLILCVGLDTRFEQSVVGVQFRKAVKNGAKLVTINPRDHNLSLIADVWFRPLPGEEIEILRSLAEMVGSGKPAPTKANKEEIETFKDIAEVARLLKESSASFVIVGSGFLRYDGFGQILEEVEKLAQAAGAGILLLPSQNNLYGSFLMGAYPGLLPGGAPLTGEDVLGKLEKVWGDPILIDPPEKGSMPGIIIEKPKVVYLIGEEMPDYVKGAEYVISQNNFPPRSIKEADLVIPAAAFTETDGTFVNREGHIGLVRKAVEPPGDALPDWRILCLIAQKMGKDGFAFSNVEEIRAEISGFIREFGNIRTESNDIIPLAIVPGLFDSGEKSGPARKRDKKYPYLLTIAVDDNIYRGFHISEWVAGFRELYKVGTVDINPEDAQKMGIEQGDEVVVSSAHFKKTWPASLDFRQAPGTLHIILAESDSMGANPQPVRIERKDV